MPKNNITFCPNCNQPAISDGKEITCENCDSVFTITKKEARVKKTGAISDIDGRLKRVEDHIFGQPADDDPAPEDPENPQDDPTPEDPEDEEIFD